MSTIDSVRVESDSLAPARYREYLLLLARMHLNVRYRHKLDASDIVQGVLLEAHKNRSLFRGTSDPELLAWLRQILACNLGMAIRTLHRDKRNITREQSLQAELDRSSARLEEWLIREQSSPSRRALRTEQVVELAEALARLPEAQRDVLVMKYCQDRSLAEIAESMSRSIQAVAGLIHRGAKQLRSLLRQGTRDDSQTSQE